MSRATRAAKAVTTAIATCGTTCEALEPNSSMVSAKALSGNRIAAAAKAPMPTARPPARPRPGSSWINTPKAPPSMIAGKIGPPRKTLSDSA